MTKQLYRWAALLAVGVFLAAGMTACRGNRDAFADPTESTSAWETISSEGMQNEMAAKDDAGSQPGSSVRGETTVTDRIGEIDPTESVHSTASDYSPGSLSKTEESTASSYGTQTESPVQTTPSGPEIIRDLLPAGFGPV